MLRGKPMRWFVLVAITALTWVVYSGILEYRQLNGKLSTVSKTATRFRLWPVLNRALREKPTLVPVDRKSESPSHSSVQAVTEPLPVPLNSKGSRSRTAEKEAQPKKTIAPVTPATPGRKETPDKPKTPETKETTEAKKTTERPTAPEIKETTEQPTTPGAKGAEKATSAVKAVPTQASEHKNGNSIPTASLIGSGVRPWRFGDPYRVQTLERLAIAFKTAAGAPQLPSGESLLLLFAQRLRGIFHPKERQFISVAVNVNGVDVTAKRAGQGETANTTTVTGSFMDGQWHTVVVAITASGASVAHFKTPAADMPGRMKLLASAKPESTVAMQVDSGVYVGGVVDRRSLTMSHKDYTNKLQCFSGSFYSKFVVNGNEVDLNGDEVGRVLPDEHVTGYYGDVLHYDLKQSIRGKVPRVKLNADDPMMTHFPVAGAVSDNHAAEIKDMIMSIAAFMKERGVLIYDLGLSLSSINTLNSFCNTTVRSSLRSNYPERMHSLHDMRWKPIIIQSVMHEFGGVLYADASIRFKKSILDIGVLVNGYGMVGFGPFDTSPTGGFTHDGTLAALAVDRLEVWNATLTIGGIQIWVDRPGVRNVLLPQLVGCALSDVCMAPNGASLYGCKFQLKKTPQFIGCHRYDQSAISVILWKGMHDITANSYQVNDPEDLKYASIRRGVTTDNPVCMRTD